MVRSGSAALATSSALSRPLFLIFRRQAISRICASTNFYRIEDGRIVEMQALWDIPEVMMQAGAWPMVPSLGREFCIPGPASGDGIVREARDPDAAGPVGS